MKKLLVIMGIICSPILYAQQVKQAQVPKAVKEAFDKHYPGTKARWEKEKENYEAGFKFSGKSMSVVINKSGTIVETETDIAITALPVAAVTYIRQNYKVQKIKEAASIVDANGVITYEAEIKNMDLIFDAAGRFLRAKNHNKEDKEDSDRK